MNMTEGRMGVTMCTFEGIDNYIAYAPLESTQWSMAIVIPVEDVTAPAQVTEGQNNRYFRHGQRTIINGQTETIRNTFIGLFIIILALVIVISYLLSKTIVNPIMTLMKGAKAIGVRRLGLQSQRSLRR